MKPSRIHLVRHGEVYNPEQILYGRLPRFGLSPKGIIQAKASGVFLKNHPLAAVFSSPLLRARQTAHEIVKSHQGLKLRFTRRLNEVFTAYEGRPAAEVDALGGDVYTGCPSGFEQPVDLVRRALLFFSRSLKAYPSAEVVGVTHGDVIVFAVLWAKGLALSAQNKTCLKDFGFPVAYPEHASITTFVFDGTSTEIKPRTAYRNPAGKLI